MSRGHIAAMCSTTPALWCCAFHNILHICICINALCATYNHVHYHSCRWPGARDLCRRKSGRRFSQQFAGLDFTAFESWWTQILYIWKRLYVFGSTCFYQSLNVNCNPSHADSCPSWQQKVRITKFLPLTPLASMKPQTAHPKRVVIHT